MNCGIQKSKHLIRFFFVIVWFMETNKTSWHSVDPVMSEVRRCCVSNYYFSEHSSKKKLLSCN